MIKLLFRLFRRQFLQLAFHSQSKPPGFDKMEQAFIDSNGKRYYRYINDFDIPILRKGKLERVLAEYSMRLAKPELDKFLDAIDLAVELFIESPKGRAKYVATISHIVEEIRNRETMIVEPDLLFELAAILYIYEDENPALVDDALQIQKVAQFKADSTGGLYDFFYSSGLMTYLPYLEKSKDDLQAYMTEAWNLKTAQGIQIASILEGFSQKRDENLKPD